MTKLIKNHIKDLRQNLTEAEKSLWLSLKARRLNGYKFRRQHLFYPYIVDFVCLEKKLIIELDGGHHSQQQSYDDNRTVFLESLGYKILRFWNDDIFRNFNVVLEVILRELWKR